MNDEAPSPARRRLASPAGFLLTAAVIAALSLGAEALGLRAYASILSGTAPPGAGGAEAVIVGLAYVILHFAAVIVAPILALAAGIWWVATRRLR